MNIKREEKAFELALLEMLRNYLMLLNYQKKRPLSAT